ncbi:hypothetical protein FRC07_001989 [Ceratobasidium sp. 392]|nr:hypothetical protein FRC07_001989 [Ceratobasidium sp. 392]
MRKEVNDAMPTTRSSGPARLSPTTHSEPREDEQAEWARLEQEMEVQRQDTTLDTISGTLHTLASQAGLIGQEVGEHNESVVLVLLHSYLHADHDI